MKTQNNNLILKWYHMDIRGLYHFHRFLFSNLIKSKLICNVFGARPIFKKLFRKSQSPLPSLQHDKLYHPYIYLLLLCTYVISYYQYVNKKKSSINPVSREKVKYCIKTHGIPPCLGLCQRGEKLCPGNESWKAA